SRLGWRGSDRDRRRAPALWRQEELAAASAVAIRFAVCRFQLTAPRQRYERGDCDHGAAPPLLDSSERDARPWRHPPIHLYRRRSGQRSSPSPREPSCPESSHRGHRDVRRRGVSSRPGYRAGYSRRSDLALERLNNPIAPAALAIALHALIRVNDVIMKRLVAK